MAITNGITKKVLTGLAQVQTALQGKRAELAQVEAAQKAKAAQSPEAQLRAEIKALEAQEIAEAKAAKERQEAADQAILDAWHKADDEAFWADWVAHHNDPQLIEANRRHDAPFSHPDFWDNRWRRKRGWLQAGGTEHGCDPTNEEGVAGLVRRK